MFEFISHIQTVVKLRRWLYARWNKMLIRLSGYLPMTLFIKEVANYGSPLTYPLKNMKAVAWFAIVSNTVRSTHTCRGQNDRLCDQQQKMLAACQQQEYQASRDSNSCSYPVFCPDNVCDQLAIWQNNMAVPKRGLLIQIVGEEQPFVALEKPKEGKICSTFGSDMSEKLSWHCKRSMLDVAYLKNVEFDVYTDKQPTSKISFKQGLDLWINKNLMRSSKEPKTEDTVRLAFEGAGSYGLELRAHDAKSSGLIDL